LRIPNLGLCQAQNTAHYTISDVNGKSVDVTITYVNNTTDTVNYHVESAATGDGSGTKIDAYVVGTSVYGDFSGITENVITSQGKITLQPGAEVYPPEGEEHGPEDYYGGDWPTAEQICGWYFEDVADLTPYPSGTIDLAGVNKNLGPIYRAGTLDIKNTSNTPATLTLDGTIYITGNTLIGTTGKDFTLDLNGHAIFVASNTVKYALNIGGKCKIVGPGVIIAVGGVYFQPKVPVGMTDPIFIMSVEATTFIQPNGDFYGSVAGSVEVQLQPGSSLNYPETGFGVLNFPGCTEGRFVYSIASWEVSRQ
jgi:hypothetical protein